MPTSSVNPIGWRRLFDWAGWPIALALCLAGCGSLPGPIGTWTTTDTTLLRSGPATRMNATAVSNTVNQAVPILYNFALLAGQVQSSGAAKTSTAPSTAEMASILAQIPRTAGNWQPIVLVGESYIDFQCNNYLEAVRLLYRQKQEGDTSLTSLQSATVGIMGLAEAAQKAIGIVGISFGLAQSLFDTHLSSYLYQLPPSSVSSIVESQRQILRAIETGQGPASAWASLNNEAAALQRLQEYITYCTPVVIEDNVSKVLNTSTVDASGTKITSTTTPAVVPIGSQFATSSDTRATLQSWLFPQGTQADQGHLAKLRACMAADPQLGTSIPIGVLINNADQEAARARVIACLGI